MSNPLNRDAREDEDLPLLEHRLVTDLTGEVDVLVPAGWASGAGLMLRFGGFASPPLVRIHSRCTYGDVFGSRHCDCGGQLAESARRLRNHGGLLFYLEQEGRGAGLRPKAAAYQAAERSGPDTFMVYEQLGLAADPRDYDHVSEVLVGMSIRSVRLLTNNPQKAAALRAHDIEVEVVPLVVETSEQAEGYISSKRRRGHSV